MTTIYIGNYFEWTGYESTMVSYIYAGGPRVTMKRVQDIRGSVTTWLFGDPSLRLRRPGATSKTYVNGAGAAILLARYSWGCFSGGK